VESLDVPDGLVLKRHRDLQGIAARPYPRWVILGLIVLFAVLALANVFGQRPAGKSATTPQAKLTLYAPEHLRSGLLFSARFHITARQELKDALLTLDQGWAEGIGINTIEPSPLGEASADGKLSFDLGHVPKGSSYVLYMQFQVNATNVAWRRAAGVTLFDGKTPLLHIRHHFTIYP
jgi:hypothetical protein